MSKIAIARFAAISTGVAMVIGSALPAGAVTVAELQAQINALMAQLAALQGGSTSATAGVTFTQNLTVGSTGSEVTALQQMLVAQGHLTMPAGVAFGFFGPLTRAAVVKWQLANGVSPASGFFGPISRARAAALGTTGGTVTGGTTTGGTTSTGVITTPGVEGTITVTRAPSPASGTKVYEGDDMKKVLGIEIEAKTSDMKVERIKLDLDETGDTASSDSAFYNKFADKVYIMDGNTVLASADLNSNTVVEESNEISITLSGMSFVVPKDTKKTLTVAVDAKASWDSDYNNDTWTVGVAAEGVRAVDGAGINQFGPTTAFSNSITSSADLVDNATLEISTNASTPDTQDVVCSTGTDEDECDELEVLRFNLKAEDDDVTVTDIVVDLTQGSATASTTVAYLYDGSTLVASETVSHDDGDSAITFDDIDFTVSDGSTKTLSLKLDITDVDATRSTWVADIDAGDVTAENSRGDGITESGSATGFTIGVRKLGPVVSLVSKSITTAGVPQSSTSNSFSTSTLTATFNVKIKAVGGDIQLGTIASSTGPLFAKTGANNSFHLYENGVISDTNHATSTSFQIPDTCTTSGAGSNSCILAEGSEVTVPVTFVIPGRAADNTAATSALYAVQFAGITWDSASSQDQTTTFMSTDTDWRTSDISFP